MLARLLGKSDIYRFRIEIFGDIKTFDFLKVKHYECGDVLTQVINITRDSDKLIGDCKIIGYRENGVLKNIRTPFYQDAKIEEAEDKFIEEVIDLNIDNKNFIGVLEHHPNLKICLDLKKAITKHIAILAKSGAGKSYTVGVILEEVLKKNIPIVILDPHNEYSTLKYPNSEKRDLKRLEKFNLKPEGFLERVKEYSPDTSINPQCEPITLDINKLKPQDLVDALPQKLSPAQQNIIFNILSNTASDRINIDELIFNISNEESTSKWSLITMLEQLKKLKLYSQNPTPLNEIVKYKRCSIISLKGVEPYVAETFVAGLLRDLFEARKKEEIPPFLLVLEEAHNFCVTGDTQILTENGLKEISKIQNENIISYNHEKETYEIDKIKKIHPKRKAEIIKLTTSSGMEIKCTKDHPIFDRGEYVPAEFAQTASIPLLKTYVNTTKKAVEARLFGALYSDGWLSKNKQVGFSGKYEDMELIRKELELLEIKTSKVNVFTNKKSSEVNTGNKIISISGTGTSICGSHSAFEYFRKKGAVIGERVIQETKIPDWIEKGNNEIKAEFLAGLMGGDGLKPIPVKNSFNSIRLYFSKTKELKNTGDKYAKEIMKLFKDLNIKTSLSHRKGNLRKKDGKETIKFIITIHNEDSNLINFFENVGYRYNNEKETTAKKALIYLKTKKELIKKQEILRNFAIKLKNEKGWGKTKIANKMLLPVTLVSKWIYEGKNYSKSAGISKLLLPNFQLWEEKNTDMNFIYDQILMQENLDEDWVYNLTTGNSNFIANGMLVHNCPERAMGETKASKTIRTIAGEGRKFGLGLCCISQRPAKVDKNVISQCSTQILLKITNPNDLKSVIASSEGVSSDSENEIQKLNIGTCLLTGVIDIPLKVNVRPRISKHGGETVDITLPYEANDSDIKDEEIENNISYGGNIDESDDEIKERDDFFEEKNLRKTSASNIKSEVKNENSELIQHIAPEVDEQGAKSMLGKNSVKKELVPASLIKLKVGGKIETNILFDKNAKKIVKNIFPYTTIESNIDLSRLSATEKKILSIILSLSDSFNPAQIMVQSDVTFNEILRVCSALEQKGILIKDDKNYKIGNIAYVKKLNELNIYPNMKFEEVSYDKMLDEKISETELEEAFSMFGTVENIKEIFVLKYS